MSGVYQPRIADGLLQRALGNSGAVLIEGPKACGKSETARQLARTECRLDVDAGVRQLAENAPEVLLTREPPVLLDEWQIVPSLWNHVRRAVDDSRARGRFILTGSATPNEDVTRHSGAGRFGRIKMRPMSLYEGHHSTGEVSLSALFDGAEVAGSGNGMTVPEMMRRIVIGGWPHLLDGADSDPGEWVQDYIRDCIEIDIPSLDGVKRDPDNMHRLFRSLARHVATATPITQITKDVDPENTPARDSVYAYMNALKRLMVIEDVPAWEPHMRTKAPLRKTPTRYFVDPSLGPAALGFTDAHLLHDLNAAGFHYEGLVMRDLSTYMQPLRGTLHTWRDATGHEIDFIINLPDGRWGACEVKLGTSEAVIGGAAASLLKFQEKVNTGKQGFPAFLTVITGTGVSYTRPDGVHVIAISTLGP